MGGIGEGVMLWIGLEAIFLGYPFSLPWGHLFCVKGPGQGCMVGLFSSLRSAHM